MPERRAETERCSDYTGGGAANQVHPGPKCACTNYLQKTYCSRKTACYRSEVEASTTSGATPLSAPGQNEACKAAAAPRATPTGCREARHHQEAATSTPARARHHARVRRKATVDGRFYGYIVYECVGHALPRARRLRRRRRRRRATASVAAAAESAAAVAAAAEPPPPSPPPPAAAAAAAAAVSAAAAAAAAVAAAAVAAAAVAAAQGKCSSVFATRGAFLMAS